MSRGWWRTRECLVRKAVPLNSGRKFMVSGSPLFVKHVFLDELQVSVLEFFILFCSCLVSICLLSITHISRGGGVENHCWGAKRPQDLCPQRPSLTLVLARWPRQVTSTRRWIQFSRFSLPGRAVGWEWQDLDSHSGPPTQGKSHNLEAHRF